jgi:hypothetical protein
MEGCGGGLCGLVEALGGERGEWTDLVLTVKMSPEGEEYPGWDLYKRKAAKLPA